MNIHVFRTGAFQVNTLVVPIRKGQALVVDPGGDVPKIVEFLASKKLRPAAIVCTHGHFDHVFGVQELQAAFPGIPLAVHQDDACYFGPDKARCLEAHGFDLQVLGLPQLTAALAFMPPPDCLLAEGDSLDRIQGIPPGTDASCWKVLHTPGHSRGSISLYHQERAVLICGDTLFYGGYGRTDLYCGDQRQLIASVRRLMRLPKETTIYPGHGQVMIPLGKAL